MQLLPLTLLVFLALPRFAHSAPVTTSDELVQAVASSGKGDTVELAVGTFKIAESLVLKSGITLKGAGIDQTTLTHVADWEPPTTSLPDPEMDAKKLDKSAYLIQLVDKAENVTLSDLTLHGPQVHGGIYAWAPQHLTVQRVKFDDFKSAGIRTFSMQHAKILDCEFVDTGGRWKRGGEPGIDGGITSGGIFIVWPKDSEIAHCRFYRTDESKERNFYGIKGRQGKRLRIHHNTIEVGFSIEFPFENDEDVEIDHNYLAGPVSIPKHRGGPVPESGVTFHLHHNWSTSGYAIEFPRNGVVIEHNLFDFDAEVDGSNLVSGFDRDNAGATSAIFHHNLVNNPGRGVVWTHGAFNGWDIQHNHIVARTTPTPRTEGLFSFHGASDFGSYTFANNHIECLGLPRPLFRNDQSGAIALTNNRLVNVSDTDRYENPMTGEPIGRREPLVFDCGVRGEFSVNDWVAGPTP